MNPLSEFSVSDLIYLFVDGEADPIQQKILFRSLSENPELQSEFQHAVEMKSGFEADKEAINPSPALTSELFKRAGFSTPLVPPGNTPVGTTGAGLLPFLKRFSIPLASALVGSIATAVFFYYYVIPQQNDIQTAHEGKLSDNNNQLQLSHNYNEKEDINSYPTVTSEENNGAGRKKSSARIFRSPKTIAGYNTSDMYNEEDIAMNSVEASAPEEPVAENAFLDMPQIDISKPNINHNYVKNITGGTEQLPLLDLSGLRNALPDELKNFIIELKGVTNIGYLPYRQLETQNLPLINNLSLGVQYKLSDFITIGGIFGRESFQMYSVHETEDGITFTKEPTIYWAGIDGKVILSRFDLLKPVYPFGEATFGMTKYGPMIKLYLGLTYNPEDLLSFSLGLEGSQLFYQLRGQTKATEKLGLVYSMGLHF